MTEMVPAAGGIRRIGKKFPFGWYRDYVRVKLLTDPVYANAAREVAGSDLPLLDLGCGAGVLALYLRECGFAGRITGVDYDGRKIATAQRVAGDERTVFSRVDLREGLPEHAGHVAVLDILQFFTPVEQEALLRGAAERVGEGGCLLIRSTLRESSLRFRLTRAGDWLAKLTFWMKAAPTAYPERETVVRLLEDCGLEGEARLLSGAMPFSNYWLVFRRRGGE